MKVVNDWWLVAGRLQVTTTTYQPPTTDHRPPLMEFRQLRTLLAIVETRNFTRAAERVHGHGLEPRLQDLGRVALVALPLPRAAVDRIRSLGYLDRQIA